MAIRNFYNNIIVECFRMIIRKNKVFAQRYYYRTKSSDFWLSWMQQRNGI